MLPVSIEAPLISYIKHRRITTYDLGNTGPGLEQAHECGRGYTG